MNNPDRHQARAQASPRTGSSGGTWRRRRTADPASAAAVAPVRRRPCVRPDRRDWRGRCRHAAAVAGRRGRGVPRRPAHRPSCPPPRPSAGPPITRALQQVFGDLRHAAATIGARAWAPAGKRGTRRPRPAPHSLPPPPLSPFFLCTPPSGTTTLTCQTALRARRAVRLRGSCERSREVTGRAHGSTVHRPPSRTPHPDPPRPPHGKADASPMLAIDILEWPGMNVAFLVSFFGAIALTASSVIPYGKRRPVGKPLSWGEAMVASWFTFSSCSSSSGSSRTSGSTGPTRAGLEQGRRPLRPRTSTTPQSAGSGPFTISTRRPVTSSSWSSAWCFPG